jgi:integrase
MSEIDRFIWDDRLIGFGRRERGGRRTWVIQYRLNGKQRRFKIGSAEKLSEAEARKVARKLLARVEIGEDPAVERQQGRSDAKHTFKSVALDYLAIKRGELRPNTLRGLVLAFGVDPDAGTGRKRKRPLHGYWQALHAVPIAAITRRDVAHELTRITHKHGAVPAGRARIALSALCTWAMREGLTDANPVVGTNKPAESKPRERVLTDGELVLIWKATPANEYGRIVKLLVLTGCRREEIGGLARSEIDPEKRMIHLPAARTKNGHPHDIWLSDLAWSVLEEQRDDANQECFFSEGGKAFTSWSRHKTALDKRIGDAVAPWTLHDIRRTVATRMADLGVLPHVIEAALNHQGGHKAGVAGIYNRSRYEREVRAAFALWQDHVRALVTDGKRKIVPLRTVAM